MQPQHATLLQVVSVIVKHAGEAGCTTADIAGEISRSHKQWKPTSVSPCLSGLMKLGCVREERQWGVRKIFHIRDYDPDKDRAKLSQLERAASKITKHETGKGPAPLRLLFAIGDKDTVTLDYQQAREFYLQLKQIFEGDGK